MFITQSEGSSDPGWLATSPKGNNVVLAILLAIAAPVLGFAVGSMKDINTGAKPPVKVGILGAGYGLLALGAGTFVIWVLVWFFSVATATQSTWIDTTALLYYSIITAAIGGTVVGLIRPQ